MRRLETYLMSKEPSDLPGHTILSYAAINQYNFSVPDEYYSQYPSIDVEKYYREMADKKVNKYIFEDLSDILHKTIYYIQSVRCESVYDDMERSLLLKDLHELLDDLDEGGSMKKQSNPLPTYHKPPPPPSPPRGRVVREDGYILEGEDKPDFQVTLNGDYEIEFVHQIEKEIDKAVNKLGFTRSGTSHYQERTEINYRQFGRVL